MARQYARAILLLMLPLGACGSTEPIGNNVADVTTNYELPADPGNIAPEEAETSNAAEVATCDSPPETGAHLDGQRLSGAGHVLEIRNGAGGGAIIKLKLAETGRLVSSFFIAQDTTASLTGIPDGRYIIQYAYGPALAEDCRSFTTVTSANQFPGEENFVTERIEEAGGTRIRRMRVTYTLYSVPDGEILPTPIDPAAFNRD